MNNKILILLSTYNGEKFVQEQIESLEKQINVFIKILIRDDGSKDSTVKILKEQAAIYKNIEIVEGNNIGCAKSFSELLLLAQQYKEFSYYAFCDQDDYWLEDKLYVALKNIITLEAEKKQQVLYCSNLWIVNSQLENKKLKYNPNYVKISKSGSLAESYGTGCTMVFNKDVLDFYCTHLPEHIHLHDLWIFHQVVFLGKIFFDDNSYILYRQHGNNVVGAKNDFKSKIKSKFKSLKTLSEQHYREYEAQEILKVYKDFLLEQDKKQIEKVSRYKEKLSKRLELFFSKKIRRRNGLDNFFFKIRVLLGCI